MKSVSIVLKGIFMGICDLVPGVSGGTIALIFGIYDEFIFSLSRLSISSLSLIKNKGFKAFWIEINGVFLSKLLSGIIIGVSLNGYRPILTHQRVEFALLSIEQIVNQAAKWSHMLGGQAHPGVTIRSIINRGGEQGAQHSQALHAWFAHVPGLRVVMPSSVGDARDLLIASVLCKDPVVFIDDRWLYEQESELPPVVEFDLLSDFALGGSIKKFR